MLGQSISRTDINTDVKKYVKVQSEILPLLSKVTPEAKRFFSADEISFVFEKSDLDDLFEQNPSANALRIYYGSRADGTPTLILVAARLFQSSNGGPGTINLISSEANAGFQWPTGVSMINEDPVNFDIISDNG